MYSAETDPYIQGASDGGDGSGGGEDDDDDVVSGRRRVRVGEEKRETAYQLSPSGLS